MIRGRRSALLERGELRRLESDEFILIDLVPFDRLLSRDDAVDGALQAHLNPRAALGTQQVEREVPGAGRGEELNRNCGQAERDVEVLQRARHDPGLTVCDWWWRNGHEGRGGIEPAGVTVSGGSIRPPSS